MRNYLRHHTMDADPELRAVCCPQNTANTQATTLARVDVQMTLNLMQNHTRHHMMDPDPQYSAGHKTLCGHVNGS